MFTATVAMTAEEVQRRREALGWSQNELARRVKRNPGHVSRVLRGELKSAPCWRDMGKAIEREEARREKRGNGDAAA
jgi:ribosome-binding protein aMBF1 (putative translation factor)